MKEYQIGVSWKHGRPERKEIINLVYRVAAEDEGEAGKLLGRVISREFGIEDVGFFDEVKEVEVDDLLIVVAGARERLVSCSLRRVGDIESVWDGTSGKRRLRTVWARGEENEECAR